MAMDAAQSPAAMVGARHVVVEGTHVHEEIDPHAARQAVRRAIQQRVDGVAAHVAAAQLPLLGGVLLVLVALTLSLGSVAMQASPLWMRVGWGLLTAGMALVLLVAPRRGEALTRWALAVAVLAAACAPLAPWLVDPQVRPALMTWAALLGVVGATALALRPAVAALLVAVPLLSSLAATGATAWTWWLVGALGSAAACAAAMQRHRGWRQSVRSQVVQGDRVAMLERERDEAWRTDQEKSRFLAIASHDLRQPVHALGLFAATLQRRLQQTPDEALARNLLRAVDGLERSFNALLDISKLDSGAVSPRLETFALRDMFRRLHMQYAGQAEFAGLGLRFSPGGKSVSSDPQLLERICGNLIQNAIKYTSQGGIVVVARTTRSCVNIEIWDTGMGITPAELPLIFHEFYQVGCGERDRSHGLGMGLAIVKRLAALLNHHLEVASTPGRGTMFRIGVPLGGLTGIQDDFAPADTQPMQMQTTRMVLVIDDEEPIREGLRLLLQEWGFQVMTAADADQAEQATAALEGRVDLVLSDLHLGPGADGIEAIAAVRRLCGRDVPAILITGDTAHERIEPVAASGDPVLFKPVQPRRLYEALRTTLL